MKSIMTLFIHGDSISSTKLRTEFAIPKPMIIRVLTRIHVNVCIITKWVITESATAYIAIRIIMSTLLV